MIEQICIDEEIPPAELASLLERLRKPMRGIGRFVWDSGILQAAEEEFAERPSLLQIVGQQPMDTK